MGQLIVRNLDEDLVNALKARAAEHGRSAEAEHRLILQEALRPADTRAFFEAAAALRRRLGRLPEGAPSTTVLIRADRDRDDAPETDSEISGGP
jgi:antitoxin FitA